jgi:hypothetical protein
MGGRHGKSFAGKSWEIYGDWTDDVTKLETHFEYLSVGVKEGGMEPTTGIEPVTCRLRIDCSTS